MVREDRRRSSCWLSEGKLRSKGGCFGREEGRRNTAAGQNFEEKGSAHLEGGVSYSSFSQPMISWSNAMLGLRELWEGRESGIGGVRG